MPQRRSDKRLENSRLLDAGDSVPPVDDRPRRRLLVRALAAMAALMVSACATNTGVEVNGAPLMNRGATLRVLDDGALALSGGPGYAYVERQLADVAVRAEITAKGNSGVFVRGAHPFPVLGGFFPSGIEAQIEANGAPWSTGAIYDLAASKVRVKDAAPVNMCVAVKGDTVLVVVDDQLASTARVQPRTGFVAVQAHDPFSDVVFRRLRMRPIDAAERIEDACALPW